MSTVALSNQSLLLLSIMIVGLSVEQSAYIEQQHTSDVYKHSSGVANADLPNLLGYLAI
jgi:hypothetical protein